MADNGGQIVYTVSADTSDLLTAQRNADKFVLTVGQGMEKADAAVEDFRKTMERMGRTVDDTGTVMTAFGRADAEATRQLRMLNAQAKIARYQAQGIGTSMTKTAQSVSRGFSGFGRNAGQAGIQLQQFIGQVQGGQSIMLATSQQAADLGFVLGFPLLGAIAGISASIAGMLLPNLFDTKDALEIVEQATENVRAAMTLSATGVDGYAQSIQILARASEQAARIQLANLIAEQAAAIKTAADGIKESVDDAFGVGANVYGSSIKDTFGEYSDDFAKLAYDIKQSADEVVNTNFSPDSIDNLTESLARAQEAGLSNTEAGRTLINTLTGLITAYEEGRIRIEDMKKQLDQAKLSFDQSADAAKRYADIADRLSTRTEELRSEQLKLEKAITLKKATEEGAEQSTLDSISTSYDKIIANAKEEESERRLARSKRERAQAERESQKASKAFIENFGNEDFSDNPDTEATGFSRTLTSQYDEKSAIETLEQQRSLVRMYQEMEVGDAEAHAEAIKAIDQKIADEKKKALDKQMKDQTDATNAQLSLYNQLFSGMQNLTTNVLASMDEQSSGYKTMFAIQKAFAVAQAIVSAELAANQILAHDAGIMGLGAVATSNIVRAMGYASAGVIAGTAMAGGRQYGGPVSEGGLYRVNENGAPEVFSAANGHQYMIPNTRGEVISNSDATGGGSGSTTINISIASDGTVSTIDGPMAKELGRFVDGKFRQLQAQSMRQGGAQWQYKQKG